MIQYEKVNDDFNLPIRLIRFEGDISEPVHKPGIIALKSYYLYVVKILHG